MSDKHTQIQPTELSDSELDAVAGGNGAFAQVTALSKAQGDLTAFANVGTQTSSFSDGPIDVGIATGISVAIGVDKPVIGL